MFISWPWLRLYAGPNALSGVGWNVWLMLFPRLDLMDRYDEGLITLAGLRFEVTLTWRVFGRFRPRAWLWIASDADEITIRIAERAGQFA